MLGLLADTTQGDGPTKRGQDTLHWVEGVYTWSRRKGLYCEDLKLEKEEEGDGGGS
jgi:hypothetical protein